MTYEKGEEPTQEDIDDYFDYQKRAALASGKAYSVRPHDYKLSTGGGALIYMIYYAIFINSI